MPAHLEKLQLSTRAQDLIAKVDLLLATGAQYKSTANMLYFEECIPSQDLKKELMSLGEEVVKSITRV